MEKSKEIKEINNEETQVEMFDGKKAIKMNNFQKEEAKVQMLTTKSEFQATRLSLKEAELKLDRKIATNSARLFLKNERHKLNFSQKLVDKYKSYGEDVPNEFFDEYKLNKDLFDVEIEEANMEFTKIKIDKTKYAIEIGQPEDKARSDVSQLNKAVKTQEKNYRIYKKRVETGFMFL